MHVQIVKFKLKPATSREKFLDLTSQMVAGLQGVEGFVSYELYEGSEHWSDRIAWKTERHAHNGLHAFLSTPIAEQMLALVESDFDSFFGEVIVSA